MLLIKNNALYNFLLYIALIILPVIATLYFVLSHFWGFPGWRVVGTIITIDAILGTLLGLTTAAYNNSEARFDGTINIFEDDDKKTFELELDEDPYDLEKKEEVIFRVNTVYDDS